MLDGADRLGPEWLDAALYVQRNGWEGEISCFEENDH